MAESGIGVGWDVDELEELEPPLPDPVVVVVALAALARVVVGVIDASVCVVEVTAEEVLEDASVLLVPVLFASTLVGVEVNADPDEGVRVACDPDDIAPVRPETLCA
jgi:hypothetical protein